VKIVFLYTELAEYFLACCRELAQLAEVHIVRWPVNKEAPFSFDFDERLKIYDKQEFSPLQLKAHIEAIGPDILVCSGWLDKDYLKIARHFYGSIPTVMTCDTHWRGDWKQQLMRLMSPFYLRNKFSHAWVPGNAQRAYMLRLGFPAGHILDGFYSCEIQHFNRQYEATQAAKAEAFPKRFLYVGRYVPHKGIQELWQAFIALQEERPNEWELWCIGTGPVEAVQHPKIRHFGFVQPGDMSRYIAETGVFILPSHFEPWGVVAHEYAAAGFPLLLSTAVGAAEAFLQEPQNGYHFVPGQVEALKNTLEKIIELDPKTLHLMAGKSHTLAQGITPAKWAKTLYSLKHD